jgi:mitochondrial fission process protein 1
VRYALQAPLLASSRIVDDADFIKLGLAVVPTLPFLFDKPVEEAVEWTFHKGFEFFGGPTAVHGQPVTGKKELRNAESQMGAKKEKEL